MVGGCLKTSDCFSFLLSWRVPSVPNTNNDWKGKFALSRTYKQVGFSTKGLQITFVAGVDAETALNTNKKSLSNIYIPTVTVTPKAPSFQWVHGGLETIEGASVGTVTSMSLVSI